MKISQSQTMFNESFNESNQRELQDFVNQSMFNNSHFVQNTLHDSHLINNNINLKIQQQNPDDLQNYFGAKSAPLNELNEFLKSNNLFTFDQEQLQLHENMKNIGKNLKNINIENIYGNLIVNLNTKKRAKRD